MAQRINRKIVLVKRPEGEVTPDCMRLSEAPAPEPAEGEALIKNLYLSLDRFGLRHGLACCDEYKSLCMPKGSRTFLFPIISHCVFVPIEEAIIASIAQTLSESDGIRTTADPVVRDEVIVAPQSAGNLTPQRFFERQLGARGTVPGRHDSPPRCFDEITCNSLERRTGLLVDVIRTSLPDIILADSVL